MAKIPLNELKLLFESGDRPTGQDFINLIDTLAANSTDLGTSGNNEITIEGIENNTIIDSFKKDDWRVVKYIVSVTFLDTENDNNKYYATEISVSVHNEQIDVTEYNVIDNDGDVGTILVSEDASGYIRLEYHPDFNLRPVSVRYARIGLKS